MDLLKEKLAKLVDVKSIVSLVMGTRTASGIL